MSFIRGEVCYIIGEDGKPERMKVAAEKELSSFCGASGKEGSRLRKNPTCSTPMRQQKKNSA